MNANQTMLKRQRISAQHWPLPTEPPRPVGWLKYYRTHKILDKSMNVGVTSPSVFVGAHNVLYMKVAGMANEEWQTVKRGQG
jgi:hypothetical protein